ncbi:2,6-dihydropseudooxynicotine hydrolase [Actinomadura rubteroloni]|uniref:2,6-dihydropseudooxynicotine hydrolase n=1 Tax=Actinomadura rubteroloni TaxID=1926885 RepID=A0A2P4UD39_9ACTN|nr:hypothetical protein [Actinomadura rubteroloni]POM22960.1 2,6-dihydropseudooxynicotine hydrolase [Actinomadura rubteroloni]
MNDLDELKRLVTGHTVVTEPDTGDVLARIVADAGDEPGSWPHEWIRAGEEHDAAGEPLAALQCYLRGRFPFVDGPGRKRAQARAVEAFDRWRRDRGIEPEAVAVDGVDVRVWTTGLSREAPRPLLVVVGGLQSPKELWAPILPRVADLGLAGVVAELPGVGENPLRYDWETPHRQFSAILDAFADRARTAETYLLASGFAGHAAILAALRDPRIRGVVGNGPPVDTFFTDPVWQAGLPRSTRDTLAHLTRVPAEEVFEHLRDWPLGEDDLRSLTVPLAMVTARRDEIVPPFDFDRIRCATPELRLVEQDDVHGTPSRLAEVRAWSLREVLRMWPGADPADRARLEAEWTAVR